MSIQIAVRLPDDLVAFIDSQPTTRAATVRRALERERRRELAERDMAIMLASPDPDLDALAEWSGREPRPDLD